MLTLTAIVTLGTIPFTDAGVVSDLSAAVGVYSTGDGGLPTARYKWTVPDLEATIDVPTVQVVNGLPVRFSAAVSRADPSFLLKYYLDEFEKAGLVIAPSDQQPDLGPGKAALTALDTDNLISYSVILQVNDNKFTTVIMGQGYLTSWLQGAKKGQDFTAIFPGATKIIRTQSEGSDFIQFSADAPVKAIQDFYRDVLKKGGYQTSADAPTVYVRARESITVRVLAPDKGRKETAVMLQRRLMPESSGGGVGR